MNYKMLFYFVAITIFALSSIPSALASYNTVTWGPETTIFFAGVGASSTSAKGISINVAANSYLNRYIQDVASLYVEMYPNSELHLKSIDRKIFTTNITTAETVCYDDYSTFDFVTTQDYKTFTITLSDGGNCPTTEVVTDTEEEAITDISGKKIDLLELLSNREISDLIVNDQISFYMKGIMEIITVKSLASSMTTVELQKLNKEINLSVNKNKNIDIDADGYRDLALRIKEIANGKMALEIKPMEKIEVAGALPGDLIKIAGSKAVYYFGPDSKRYVFPNEKVYYTWYSDFGAVKTISSEEIAKLPLGGLVTYKPGVKMIKFITSPNVYVVARGGELRKLKDEIMAKNIFGEGWNKRIDDINDAFWGSYSFGKSLENDSDYDGEAYKAASQTISIDKDI